MIAGDSEGKLTADHIFGNVSIIKHKGIDVLGSKNGLPVEDRSIVGDAKDVPGFEPLSIVPFTFVSGGGRQTDFFSLVYGLLN